VWPPLLRILIDEPSLLAGHATAYAALIKQDAAGWQARLARRLGYVFLLVAGMSLALLLAGIALMLHAVTHVSHWLLWVVPAVPLGVAAIASWCLRREAPAPRAFAHVRRQVAEDLQLFGWKETER